MLFRLKDLTIRVVLCLTIFVVVSFMTLFCNADNSESNSASSCQNFAYNEPIDYNSGIINNDYWGIDMDTHASDSKNAKAISAALQWAATNNIKEVKLETGVYYINGQINETDGIEVPSNMHFNLNGSTLIQPSNSSKWYNIIRFSGKENIIISNGILIGDRETHDYASVTSTHEFGFGIICFGSKNVTINNLKISEMTGDAICISGNGQDTQIAYGGTISHDITIKGCNFSYCRRSGISVTGAENVEISYCDVNNIKGTCPECGIVLEGDLDFPVNNVKIYDNTFSRIEKVAVIFHKNSSNCILENNIIDGSLSVYAGQNNIIRNNSINNGGIYLTSTNNVLNTKIEDNQFVNGFIVSTLSSNTTVTNNTIENGYIVFVNSSGVISNNIIDDSSKMRSYALMINADNNYGNSIYFVHYCNNTIKGNFYQGADVIGLNHNLKIIYK